MQYIDADEILRATDGGLDIILSVYPDARESAHKPNRKFKIREEKTASVSLHKKHDSKKGMDVWLVTDFGGDSVPRNGILIYALENNLEYAEAIQQLAAQYNIIGSAPEAAPRAEYSERAASSDEPEGKKFFELRESFTDFEIETLFAPNVLRNIGWFSKDPKKKEAAYARIRTICTRYNFHPAISYSLVKNRKVMTFSSTDRYPIFIFTEPNNFNKIYQPLHPDKGRRFMSTGDRPKDYIHGLAAAQAEFKRREESAMGDDDDYDAADEDTKREKRKIEKLDAVILATGGSDALNLALLGHWPVWLNSETADFTDSHWFALIKIANKIYQLQDIDATGRAEAHKKAMERLDMYTIELPERLSEYSWRGKPCKDVRDYFRYWTSADFDKLMDIALPYRFWDRRPQFAGRGSDRVMTGYIYEFNNVAAYNFLSKNGFYRLESEARKTGYMFIKIEGNIVREVEGNDVKNFIHEFLRERMLDIDLRNAMFRTTQLSESSLSNLPFIDIQFKDSDKNEQFYIFENATVQVTASGITRHKPGSVQAFVWDKDVIDHFYRPQDPAFTITHDDGQGRYMIDIKHNDCLFFNYLIQTSRVHWRQELEHRIMTLPPEEREAYRTDNKFNIAGPLLNDEEIQEQRTHLMNKVFAIGYLLHRYKDPTRPWCVFAMDNHINDDGRSHGGSGKSLLFNVAIPNILRQQFYLGGRNPKITDNPHIYDGLTKHHRFILIDDADEYINFSFFFDALTGRLKVNPKNHSPYTIEFEDVGKFAITSNHVVKGLDPSTERRLLYTVFSDYYHSAGEMTDYLESRSPADDMGKQLFSEFSQLEWDHFYSTMMSCLQFYLSVSDRVDPPMNNVTKRNLLSEMGPDFEEWAVGYFSTMGDKVDRPVVREEAKKDFDLKYRRGWATRKFSAALRAFCKYHGYVLNPKSLINTTSGTPRIIMRVDDRKQDKDGRWYSTGEKSSKDMIYIQTRFDAPPSLEVDPALDLPEDQRPLTPDDSSPKLPF